MSENDKKPEVGTYIVGVAILGGIGIWLGGWIGFAIGAGIAIWAIRSNSDEEAKKKASPSKSTTRDDTNENDAVLDKEPVTSTGFNYSFYSKLVPELLAVCITADGSIEENEVETATLLIENDEYIKDKQGALESLSVNIEMLSAAIEKSKAVFKLKASPIIHKAININDSLGSVRKVGSGRIDAMTVWRHAWQSVTNFRMQLGSSSPTWFPQSKRWGDHEVMTD